MLDPKQYGLPSRTVLEQVSMDCIALVIDRKSRIIMADGRKIVEKAERIKNVLPEVTVILKTTAPVCSKTVRFLQEKDIDVVPVGE